MFAQLNNCVCPGDVISYECAIVGGGATLWRGSAFNCPSMSNEIVLRHAQFKSAVRDCNDEIVAYSVGTVTLDNNLKCYVSRLNVTVNDEMRNTTIQCVHDFLLSQPIVVGTTTLDYTTGDIVM